MHPLSLLNVAVQYMVCVQRKHQGAGYHPVWLFMSGYCGVSRISSMLLHARFLAFLFHRACPRVFVFVICDLVDGVAPGKERSRWLGVNTSSVDSHQPGGRFSPSDKKQPVAAVAAAVRARGVTSLALLIAHGCSLVLTRASKFRTQYTVAWH